MSDSRKGHDRLEKSSNPETPGSVQPTSVEVNRVRHSLPQKPPDFFSNGYVIPLDHHAGAAAASISADPAVSQDLTSQSDDPETSDDALSRTIHVVGFPDELRKILAKNTLEQFGVVAGVRWELKKATGKKKSHMWITFATQSSACDAAGRPGGTMATDQRNVALRLAWRWGDGLAALPVELCRLKNSGPARIAIGKSVPISANDRTMEEGHPEEALSQDKKKTPVSIEATSLEGSSLPKDILQVPSRLRLDPIFKRTIHIEGEAETINYFLPRYRFVKFGLVVDVRCQPVPFGSAHAFVTFATEQSARNAVSMGDKKTNSAEQKISTLRFWVGLTVELFPLKNGELLAVYDSISPVPASVRAACIVRAHTDGKTGGIPSLLISTLASDLESARAKLAQTRALLDEAHTRTSPSSSVHHSDAAGSVSSEKTAVPAVVPPSTAQMQNKRKLEEGEFVDERPAKRAATNCERTRGCSDEVDGDDVRLLGSQVDPTQAETVKYLQQLDSCLVTAFDKYTRVKSECSSLHSRLKDAPQFRSFLRELNKLEDTVELLKGAYDKEQSVQRSSSGAMQQAVEHAERRAERERTERDAEDAAGKDMLDRPGHRGTKELHYLSTATVALRRAHSMLDALSAKSSADRTAQTHKLDQLTKEERILNVAHVKLQDAKTQCEMEGVCLNHAGQSEQHALEKERFAHQSAISAFEAAIDRLRRDLHGERADRQSAAAVTSNALDDLTQQWLKERMRRCAVEVSLQQARKLLEGELLIRHGQASSHVEEVKQLRMKLERAEMDSEAKYLLAKSEWEAEEARLIDVVEAEYGARKAAEARLKQTSSGTPKVASNPDTCLKKALRLAQTVDL